MEHIGGAIIGGGAVGCSVLLELTRAGLSNLFLFEQAPHLADRQSGRNSGVIHAGIYYGTDSNKAQLCVEANPLLYEFCTANDVPAQNVGKLVVATDESELAQLHDVYQRASNNGVRGIRTLEAAEVRDIEPNVAATAALWSPTTGVIEASSYTNALSRCARALGAQVLTNTKVIRLEPERSGFRVTVNQRGEESTVLADFVVNAAGHNAATIATWIDPERVLENTPLRGEYVKFNRRSRPDLWLNGANIYPVPQMVDVEGQMVETVGAHLTPTFEMDRNGRAHIGNTVILGPEMSHVNDPEDYESARTGPELFLERGQRFFPSLRLEDLKVDFAGVMVTLRDQKDWIIERDAKYPDCIQLLGIDSPGLTASLAIGRRVQQMLLT